MNKTPHNWLQPFRYARVKDNQQMLSPSDCSLNSLRKNHGNEHSFWEMECSSLGELLRMFDERKGLVFRGQASASWELDSSLVRLMKNCGVAVDKSAPINISSRGCGSLIFDEHVLKKVIPSTQEMMSSEQKLVFAQHYGYPTNLLDWTESLNNALFFAFENAPQDDSDQVAIYSVDVGKVYILEYCRKGRKEIIFDDPADVSADDVLGWLKHGFVNESFDHWMFVRLGDFWDLRMSVQETVLSIQGWPQSLGDYLRNCETPAPLPGTLVKVKMPVSARPEVMEYLENEGISRESIFPDMDALCAQAKSQLIDSFVI